MAWKAASANGCVPNFPAVVPAGSAGARLRRCSRKRAGLKQGQVELKQAQGRLGRAKPVRVEQEREAAKPGPQEWTCFCEWRVLAPDLPGPGYAVFSDRRWCTHRWREAAALFCVRVLAGRSHRGSARNSSRHKTKPATPRRRFSDRCATEVRIAFVLSDDVNSTVLTD